MYENIGQIIRQLRTDARLSQQELAGNLYTKAYVSQVEKGKVKPSKKALQHFAEVLAKPFLASMGAEETQEFQRIVTLIDYARSLSRDARHSEARIAFDEAVALSEEFRYPALKVKALLGLSQAHLAEGSFDQATDLAKQANRLAGQLGEPGEIAQTLVQLGHIFAAQHELQDAALAYEDAIRLLKNTQDPAQQSLLVGLLTSHGQLLGSMGFVDRAITTFKRSVELAEQLESLEYQAKSHMGIGLAHYRAGNYYEAMNHTRRAMTIYEMLDNSQLKADLLHQLAEAEARLGNTEQALLHFQESITLIDPQRAGDLVEILTRMANLQLQSGDLKGALVSIDLANGRTSTIAPHQVVRLKIVQAKVLRAQGQLGDAQAQLQDTLAILNSHNLPKLRAMALAEQAGLFKQQGRLEESLACYEQSMEIMTKEMAS
ncbi:MAG: tetratricopeptide repeat protein [Bacillota bacterium]